MAANAPDSLTPEQEQAIVALLNEPTVNKAAAKAGVGERTLYRWLTESAFSKAYRDLTYAPRDETMTVALSARNVARDARAAEGGRRWQGRGAGGVAKNKE